MEPGFGGANADGQVALGDLHPGGAVTIDAHGAQMHQMDVPAALHDGGADVIGGVEVVVHRVTLVARALHGVGRGALFGEMDDGVGPEFVDQGQQPLVFAADRDVLEADLPAGEFLPCPQPLTHEADGRQRIHLQLVVDVAS